MLNPPPPPPPRQPQPGFLYLHPWRVQGVSIAGEATCIHIPEFDLLFDIGLCPRFAVGADTLALTHGHMDHAAAFAYWFSQRYFLGCKPGRLIAHPKLAESVRKVMQAWVGIERQRTPYEIIALEPNDEVPLKGNIVLRGFSTRHTADSLGYCAVEKRSKLKPELHGLSQAELLAIKERDEAITDIHEIPLVCFTGDTSIGDHLMTDEVLKAKLLITECTFVEDEHDNRADIGKHMHLDDLVELLKHSEAEHVVITHLSRRTHLPRARELLRKALPDSDLQRIHLLMDHSTNKAHYQNLCDQLTGNDPQPKANSDD